MVGVESEILRSAQRERILRDLQQDPRLPVGLELVVYGSAWVGHSQLYSFPMKPQLDASIQQWAQQIESISVYAAISAALAMDGNVQPS